MRDYVDRRRQAASDYDTWFRVQIQASLGDPRPSIPHDEVMQSTHAMIDGIVADKTITSIE